MVMASSKSGTCQDCGNKAKRDCEHKRCRTCCKTRSLPCPTHVRSTWIPVSRRRQILHHRLAEAAASSALPLRLISSPGSPSSGFQGRIQSFPAEVSSLANFRCVRVISEDNVVDQAAYQASVNIGGHVFSGILYDHGPSSTSPGAGGGGELLGTSGGSVGGSNFSYLQYPVYASNATFILPDVQFFPHPKP